MIMKKISAKKRIIFVAIVGLLGLFVMKRCFANNMNKLPKGEYLSESTSSDGMYKIKTYLCDGGITTDYAVRAEVIKKGRNKGKNIYWDYHVKDGNIVWIDNDTVEINNHKIDLLNGKYDWREDN